MPCLDLNYMQHTLWSADDSTSNTTQPQDLPVISAIWVYSLGLAELDTSDIIATTH